MLKFLILSEKAQKNCTKTEIERMEGKCFSAFGFKDGYANSKTIWISKKWPVNIESQ